MPTIGISMIAHNEERQIANALQSSMFADDIVVVNCESTDKTAELAKTFARVRLFERPNNKNLNVNKSYGFDQLTTDYIFYLDPDEIITPELAAEIRQAISSDKYVAWKLPRRNIFFGRWLAHGSQYPDLQLRLFKRGCASFANQHVHEMLQVNGETGQLQNAFEHHPYPEIADYLRKMIFYTGFQAEFWNNSGISTGFFNTLRYMFFRPYFRFMRRYLLKQGFRDGWQGFVAAAGDAFQTIFSYGRFLEMRNRKP
ncbi:MAG TPA: glycosyltransferase family 2 protein [Candidatus Rifleibacterium sp.]|nr:glycosyltransferase family 2 protein [Candidatus Rifleibacterium sp.]HPT46703.1 glycosyltransferase family 2 protein [Candidatus Rifleibacterium sp.]